MRRKEFLRRASAISVAALLTMNLCACQKEEAVISEEEKASNYQVTEENENKELVMNRQPESSYWFPEELLEWNPEEDQDLIYNISKIPLAKRVDHEYLTPVNETQNKDIRVMAISIMNSSTSGNAPHGLNSANCNVFTYWQYVDELVYWGGSSGEGLIVPPSPDVTDLGHKNGVPVIGTVFFPQGVAGGKMEWLDTFLSQEKDGSFPLADKLIEVAEIYGFDGWFINQETEGTEEQPLTKDYGKLIPKTVKGTWDAYSEKQMNKELLIAYGFGDGGGVNRDMLENRRRIDKIPGLPNLKTSTAAEYFRDLQETVKNTDQYVHTWDGELYLEYHRGTYTSQA